MYGIGRRIEEEALGGGQDPTRVVVPLKKKKKMREGYLVTFQGLPKCYYILNCGTRNIINNAIMRNNW